MSKAIHAIEQAAFIDPAAKRVAAAAARLYPGGTKDLASGTRLGHPAHPVLTDLPVGFWTGATVLDLLGGRRSAGAADKLVLAGLLSALPTAWTGLSDWSDTTGRQMRVGAVHAAGNIAGMALYGASWLARKRGHRATGIRLAMMGAATMACSGYLGGHLAFRLGVGVDQTVFDDPPSGWTSVMAEQDLLEGSPEAARVNGIDLVLYRSSSEIFALADRCSHRGGPLHLGKVDHLACAIICPWHASKFSLETGEVLQGPATAPQPVYQTRVEAGNIQVRPAK